MKPCDDLPGACDDYPSCVCGRAWREQAWSGAEAFTSLGMESRTGCNGVNHECEPVHQHDDGTWWFYDETWSDEWGPYPDAYIAGVAVAMYCVAYGLRFRYGG